MATKSPLILGDNGYPSRLQSGDTLSLSSLGTGTANSTTYLRGDGTWQTITSGVAYNGTTATAGQFDGGTTTPTGTTRLNYGGYFYPSYINLTGSADTATAASHYMVETGSDGFVRPKTLANVKSEILGGAILTSTQLSIQGNSTANAIEIGRIDGTSSTPCIDFHSGATATDFDARIIANGGNGTSGQGNLTIVASSCAFSGIVSATNFNSLSDVNKKTNINTISNAIDKLTSLRGVDYTWKDTGAKSMGVIAQELEQVLPELVHTSETGEKSVFYGNLVGLLIEAIKDQQEEIKMLKINMEEIIKRIQK